MDPFLLLQAEHEMLRSLLAMLRDGPQHGRARKHLLLRRVADIFGIHSAVEEKIFSLAILRHPEKEAEHPPLFVCLERHRTIMSIVLPDLLHADAESSLFKGRLQVLIEYAGKLFDEEDGEIFPRLMKTFTTKDMEGIANMIESRAAGTTFRRQ